MSKKKIFMAMLVLTMMLSGFSLAIETDGMGSSVASILKYDALTGHEQVLNSLEKVKRRDKVARTDVMQFIKHEDIKDFRATNGAVSNSMIVEQARRDIESVDMRFEDLK
ncbi:MAG: hypothetical protein Q8P68_05010 [Candidatus Peregrinibacteria bacterium]|nr:hypothetical protein [Candidatus Peregrinibacteria bacterium]MDZ4244443.1 hypothetical protein [Candidatus Gracilibacteria bacterium]